jgi:hypothetical protein
MNMLGRTLQNLKTNIQFIIIEKGVISIPQSQRVEYPHVH